MSETPKPDAVAREFKHFRCLSCGFQGAITTEEIATHRSQCAHGPTIAEAEPDAVAPVSDVPSPDRLQDYWRCFHCDFATTNFRDAYAHFGDRDDAEEFKPICKWWANMEPAERQETFQGVVRELNDVKEDNDNLVERLNQIEARATEYANQRNEKTIALAQAEARAAKAEVDLQSVETSLKTAWDRGFKAEADRNTFQDEMNRLRQRWSINRD